MKNLPDKLLKNITAFYTFDISLLKERIQYLRNQLPSSVSLCYAVKANTFLIRELTDAVERFEICSPGEAEICAFLGIPSEKMVISGVYKTPSFIEGLLVDPCFKGIFTVESLLQYELLCKAPPKEEPISLLLRLTNDSQFGINEEDIERILANRNAFPHIHILGIQFFSGTQKTSAKKLRREIEHLDMFLQHLKESYAYEAEELEYGPGFPITYFSADVSKEEELFKELSESLCAMKNRPKITLELGRSIAASCGRYYTHIVDMKRNKGQNYLLVDGGMHHLVYYGQHMAMKQPYFSVVGKETEPAEETWNICGSLCSMNDILVKQTPLPHIAIGDMLCFQNTGAYCMTEGISLFLSRDLPCIYLLLENGEIIEARGSFETSILNTPNYERKF